MPFQDDLLQYGPDANRPGPTPREEALAYCEQLTASHYENFSVVNWLTPRALRPGFRSIYAFCRWSDDLGDEIGNPTRSLELLAWWRGELRAMFDGQAPCHPVMVALAETVREFSIPIAPFEALISAFEQDQTMHEYTSFNQLLDYCTRSANPVGHLVLYLGRCHDEANARLADFTCTGLQLANFWQDVSRDLAIGRVYLPLEDRQRFEVKLEDLHARKFNPEFAAMLRFEVDRARAFLKQGRPLIDRLPGTLALDVDLFSRGGLAILDRIEACRFDVLTARPRLGKLAKVGLIARALLDRARTRPTSRVLAGSTS